MLPPAWPACATLHAARRTSPRAGRPVPETPRDRRRTTPRAARPSRAPGIARTVPARTVPARTVPALTRPARRSYCERQARTAYRYPTAQPARSAGHPGAALARAAPPAPEAARFPTSRRAVAGCQARLPRCRRLLARQPGPHRSPSRPGLQHRRLQEPGRAGMPERAGPPGRAGMPERAAPPERALLQPTPAARRPQPGRISPPAISRHRLSASMPQGRPRLSPGRRAAGC